MAKRKVNMTQAIREHWESNPDDKPKAIVAALKAKRIQVPANYVSLVLTKLRKQTKRTKSSGAVQRQSFEFGYPELQLAKQLLVQAGNADVAKQVIDALADLRA